MKYAVGAGHTKKGIGTGAVGKINESIETRVVAPLVVNYLRLVGEEAELLVVDEITKPLDDCRWRADRANELKASRYVEIHFNAGGGRGSEVYAVSNAGKVMAQGVVNSICALGFANRGVKSNDYIVLTRTDMPAILIECCFVDSDEDAKLYNADKMARTIVTGLTGKVVPEAQDDETAPVGQYFRVQLGAYTNKSNAIDMQNKLKAAGFDSIIKLY